jgi:hypothetical protein
MKFILSISAAAALTAFSAVFYAKDNPKGFSHKRHVEEYNAECANCHNDQADPPAFKGPASCKGCHDEALDKPVLKAKAKRYEIIFSHELHNNVATCIECHKTTVGDKQKKNRPMMSFARCVSCHEENAIEIPSFQCTACHRKTNRQTKPDNHKQSWMTSHGKVAEWNLDKGHGSDCMLCHTQSNCTTCHRTMKPKSHSGLWRIRTHGIYAEFDRDRCKTCHETGVCINCHRNTKPQNHRGAWKKLHGTAANTDPEKCRVCHSASFGSSAACVECHRGSK